VKGRSRNNIKCLGPGNHCTILSSSHRCTNALLDVVVSLPTLHPKAHRGACSLRSASEENISRRGGTNIYSVDVLRANSTPINVSGSWNKKLPHLSFIVKGEIDVDTANRTIGPELVTRERRPTGVSRQESIIENTPQQILLAALETLSRGRFSEVVKYFDACFKFNDHACSLEFTDKLSLTEFFQKSRERFPDTTLEIVSVFEDGDHAITE